LEGVSLGSARALADRVGDQGFPYVDEKPRITIGWIRVRGRSTPLR